jgi:2-aminoethylphosphonate-pyruvate transaminase
VSLTLFTPGPVKTPPLVNEWLARPPCQYHRERRFAEMCEGTEAKLKALLGLPADEWFATLVAATGTGANEAALGALGGTGRGAIVTNGFFGDRLVDQAAQAEVPHLVLRAPADRPLDAAAVEAFLDEHPGLRWLFFVAHETRTGLLNPMIGGLARRRGMLSCADIVSAAYALPLELAELDLAVASSAKGIMAVPGVGMVFVRLAALPALAAAARPSYYLDLVEETRVQRQKRQPRFAQPVALHAALHAACLHLETVGIGAHQARIQRQMRRVTDGLAGLGRAPLLPPASSSGVAVNFDLPPGLVYADFAARMEALGYFLLYGVPGDASHFQVSTMGDLTDGEVTGLVGAFGEVLAFDSARGSVRYREGVAGT